MEVREIELTDELEEYWFAPGDGANFYRDGEFVFSTVGVDRFYATYTANKKYWEVVYRSPVWLVQTHEEKEAAR